MNGDFVGEFVRGVSTTVPLWVALYLKKLDKCKVRHFVHFRNSICIRVVISIQEDHVAFRKITCHKYHFTTDYFYSLTYVAINLTDYSMTFFHIFPHVALPLQITIPDTHTVPSLSLILANESASDSALSALPPFFFELARALLAHARADLPDPAAFESLLKDTEDLRAAKIRDRVKRIGEKQLQIFSVQNLTPYELRGQAGVVRATLDAFLAIDRSGPGAEDAEGGR